MSELDLDSAAEEAVSVSDLTLGTRQLENLIATIFFRPTTFVTDPSSLLKQLSRNGFPAAAVMTVMANSNGLVIALASRPQINFKCNVAHKRRPKFL